MPSKAGKGRRAFQDAIDSLHTDLSLSDAEKRGLQNVALDLARVTGGPDGHLDQTVTFTYNVFRGANASVSVSLVT
jgi:hypothetical protein